MAWYRFVHELQFVVGKTQQATCTEHYGARPERVAHLRVLRERGARGLQWANVLPFEADFYEADTNTHNKLNTAQLPRDKKTSLECNST